MTRDMDLVRKILLEMEASPNGFVEIRALGVARGDKFRAVCHLTLSRDQIVGGRQGFQFVLPDRMTHYLTQ